MVSTVMLVVIAVFVVVALFAAKVDGVALIGPKRTTQMSDSAHRFCVGTCRDLDGSCPIEDYGIHRTECPLWQFVDADAPIRQYGNPFAHLAAKRT